MTLVKEIDAETAWVVIGTGNGMLRLTRCLGGRGGGDRAVSLETYMSTSHPRFELAARRTRHLMLYTFKPCPHHGVAARTTISFR